MDYLEEQAERAEEKGDFAVAAALWRRLAEKDRDPLHFVRYGRVAQNLENWDEAEQAYAEALRIDPNLHLAMEALGDLWATRTDKDDRESFEQAKEWFLKALQGEHSSRTLTFLGGAYLALEDYDAARQAFEEALLVNPQNEEALYNIATIDAKKDPQKSIDLLEKAVEIDPDYSAAHQQLGRLYHGERDLARAEYHFRRSFELDPHDVFSSLYLANILAVQGKTTEAERTYRLAVSLHPNNKDAGEFFARFLEFLGRNEEATEVRSHNKP